MIKFEKISLEQFKKDMKANYPNLTDTEIEDKYNRIQLPKRGSKYSAGYDIYSTMDCTFFGNTGIVPSIFGVSGPKVIPTGIKAVMPGNMFLNIVPRSGLGFKSGVSLANTIGIIDSDYYNNDKNEGHIMIMFVPGFDKLDVKEGDRIAQGIFTKYYTTDDDEAQDDRKGGFGSTGSK